MPDELQKPRMRMWITECVFKKNGFPSLGSFGRTSAPVVIIPLATWQKLCHEIPELGTREFEVGSEQ